MKSASHLNKILVFFLLMALTTSFANTNTSTHKKHHIKNCKHIHKYAKHSIVCTKSKVSKTKAPIKTVHHKEPCKVIVQHIKPKVVIAPCPKPKVLAMNTHVYKPHRQRCFKDIAPCPTPTVLHDGFYLGVAGGVDSYRIHQEHVETFPFIVSIEFNPALSAVGMVGGLYAGYGKYFNNLFYAGAEIFGNTTGASTAYTISVNSIGAGPVAVWQSKIHVNSNFGISLLPGFKLNDSSLLYLRFGYSRLSMRTNESETFLVFANGSNGRTNWTTGIAYGIGLETAIYQNWSLRGEYTHTEYHSIRAPDMLLVTTEGPSPNLVGSLYFPSNNQYMLGLSYHFC